ncbi:uncharacterized protein LOC132615284 [Lycium barbarum]|uniref:uncharacterized protein LOC132615284 n=1 Tax=Lycium barbarum TaxID=112863 RepID=UPI00293F2DBE|nr:uncharacterized protein LOC132615284 [Lycium barbarum]
MAVCFKDKEGVLGEAHPHYADTIYHLGTVLYLQGKYKDSEALVHDSIWILEYGSQGESMICTKRMRQLAEVVLCCICTKGGTSLEAIIAAERLALTLQSLGNLKEAEELLESVDWKNLVPSTKEKGNEQSYGASLTTVMSRQSALASKEIPRSLRMCSSLSAFVQSLNALSLLEMTKLELGESKGPYNSEAESALRECLSAYKKFVTEKSLSDAPGVKAEYLLCLKHLVDLISDNKTSSADQSGKAGLKELKDEIKRVEVELSTKGRRRS